MYIVQEDDINPHNMRMIQIDSKLSNTPIKIVNIRRTWWKQTFVPKKMNKLDILDLLELGQAYIFSLRTTYTRFHRYYIFKYKYIKRYLIKMWIITLSIAGYIYLKDYYCRQKIIMFDKRQFTLLYFISKNTSKQSKTWFIADWTNFWNGRPSKTYVFLFSTFEFMYTIRVSVTR